MRREVQADRFVPLNLSNLFFGIGKNPKHEHKKAVSPSYVTD